MSNEEVNYYTHGTGGALRAHEWRYLGRDKQAYRCAVCQLEVSKGALKGATD